MNSTLRQNTSNATFRRRVVTVGLVMAASIGIVPQLVLAAPADGADGSGTDTTTTVESTTTTTTTVPATTTTTSTTTTTTTVPATTTTVPATTTTTPETPETTAPATTAPATTTTVPAPTTTIAPAAQNVTVYSDRIGDILATIRYLESRGQYGIPPNKGNASGAYQFIASTWQNYGGYPHAYLAPPEIQDARAAEDVTLFLSQWNNDVSMIPVLWYYPRAARDPALMDIVPVPSAGNVLTIREYQTRWLGIFASISGNPVPQPITSAEFASRLGVPPTPALRDDELPSLAFPVLGPARVAAPDCSVTDADAVGELGSRADIEAAGLCTEAAPSIIFGVKLQPILAAVDGVVTNVQDQPGSGIPISVTITDIDGRSYIYSGFNDDNPGTNDGAAPEHLRLSTLAKVGQVVWAGQIIGFMGDTEPLPIGVRADVPTDASITIDEDSVAPHLRLTILDLGGQPVEAFGPVIDAVFTTTCHVGIGQWSVPARDGSTEPVVIETTDNNNEIDSEWIITETGQVTAAGWAAMINPNEQCSWAPEKAYGPGGEGSDDVPGRWFFGIDLPTAVWLQLALAEENGAASPLFRF